VDWARKENVGEEPPSQRRKGYTNMIRGRSGGKNTIYEARVVREEGEQSPAEKL